MRLPVVALAAGLALGGSSPGGFEPVDLGSELWTWLWAGPGGENVTTEDGPDGPLITRIADLSGRGHDAVNDGVMPQAGFQVGLELGPGEKGGAYSTSLPLIGMDEYSAGGELYGNAFDFGEPFVASGPFYLATVCMNTRTGGLRELFGSSSAGWIRFQQEHDDVYIKLGSDQLQLNLPGSLPHGIMVLEVWRDSEGDLTCLANGADITLDGVRSDAPLTLSGLGFDRSGTSAWDDYWMEFVLCDALPTEVERDQVREYLGTKWDVWGTPELAGAPPTVIVEPGDQAQIHSPRPLRVTLSDPDEDLVSLDVFGGLDAGRTFFRVPLSWWQVVQPDPETNIHRPALEGPPSLQLECIYLLPPTGYLDLTLHFVARDAGGNITAVTVTYYPGQ